MKSTKQLYVPTPDGNPFYKLALAADFSNAEGFESTREAFASKLAELVTEIEVSLAPITSLTRVSETLHYSAMAAGLLQLKATYQYATLKKNAPPEVSVANSVMSGFGGNIIDSDYYKDDFGIMRSTEKDYSEDMAAVAKKASELGRMMEVGFDYSGKAMRALATISLSCHSSCKWSDGGFSRSLTDYYPTKFLAWNERIAELFPVIGVVKSEEWARRYNPHTSPERGTTYWMELNTESQFSQVFSKKLAELLALGGMSVVDRTRLEELRIFYFRTMCKMIFNISSSNFPRVLQLVNAVKVHLGEDGRIKEGDLAGIIPTECAALADREAILTKDYVGMDGIFYRISDGLKSFAQTAIAFNLLSKHMLTLTREVLL